MHKPLLYIVVFLTAALFACGQSPVNRSSDELRRMIRDSKPDSNRILFLLRLGRNYLKQIHSDRKQETMDTALGIFHHAMLLSDTLHRKDLRLQSLLLQGEAWFLKDNEREGKNIFFNVADIYRNEQDLQEEAATYLRLARNINWFKGSECEIPDYFQRSIYLYHLTGKPELEKKATQFYGEFLLKQTLFASAEEQLLKAIDLSRQAGIKKVADTYFLLSVMNRYQAAFDKSLFYATKCIETMNAENDTTYIDLYYGELGLVYDELNRVDESAVWYLKALNKRVDRNGDPVDIFRTASFLIRQWKKTGKNKQSLELMNELVVKCPPRSLLAKATVAQNYALCLDGLQRYDEAEKYLLEMTQEYHASNVQDEFVNFGRMDIARFYLQRREFEKGRVYLDSAMGVLNVTPMSVRKDLHHLLFIADSALGNYKSAINDLRTYQTLSDSIFNERKSRQIEFLTMQFRTAEKEQSITLLEKEKKIQQNQLEKEQHTRSWILGAVALMLVIIGLLTNYLLLKQRTNKKLKAQQNEIEKKNETLQHLVEEKEWLVKEIHHRVKNNFHIVQGLLGTQSRYLKSEEAINALADSRHRIQAMSIMHQKLYQSEDMSSINISEYIHELISHLRSSFHTRQSIQFRMDIDPIQLNTSYCIPIGLILNEAVTNSIKYAFPDERTGQISISLKRDQSNITVTIGDNGVGLPDDFNVNNPHTMGLRLMNGLSQDLEGELRIINDNGTTIIFEFDLGEDPVSSSV